MGNHSIRTTMLIAATASALLLGGCATASAPNAQPVASVPPGSGTPSPSAAPCALAGSSALAAVNASIAAEPGFQQPGVEPYPQVLDELAATRYEPLDIWTLTGVFDAAGSEGGYLAVWATREDPTAEGFAGEILAFAGTSSESDSAAPVLVPGYVGEHDMDMVPSSALNCGDRLL